MSLIKNPLRILKSKNDRALDNFVGNCDPDCIHDCTNHRTVGKMQNQIALQKGLVRHYLFPDDAWYELIATEVSETTVVFEDKLGHKIVCQIQTVIAFAEELPAHIGRKAR